MKKLSILLTLLIIISFTTITYALNPPTIYINGKQLISENQPIIIDGRTYVPLRAISENLGYDIQFNEQLNRININNKISNVSIGEKYKKISDGLLSTDIFFVEGISYIKTYMHTEQTYQTWNSLTQIEKNKFLLNKLNEMELEKPRLSRWKINIYDPNNKEIVGTMSNYKDEMTRKIWESN